MGPAGQHMLNTCSIKTLLSSLNSDEKKNQEYKRSQRNNLSLK